MDRRTLLNASMILAAGAALSGTAMAQGQDAALPAPAHTGGMPLMEALSKRHTQREFADKELPRQVLADLLWAAFGVNRPDSGKRTAPSCLNWQETELYAVTASGVMLYDARAHALKRISDKDLRAATGRQAFAAHAPLNVVMVADFSRMPNVTDMERHFYAGTDTGVISQNMALYCASAGLATVVRANVDKQALATDLGLREGQWITLVQTVGYPKA